MLRIRGIDFGNSLVGRRAIRGYYPFVFPDLCFGVFTVSILPIR